ncbi:MAG: hypothetical protein KDA96_21540 [Planctomycetaceae bacterium]|nr:hypothetical protein [Planctomycetaceae bacterium]
MTADLQPIRIRGARTHNLRGIDLQIPTGKLVVITGVSGSGKSSLAFDTLFAEGQRRYLESVSVHTRSLIRQLQRPDVDEISGLPPTVCVDQRAAATPIRSTLAVTAEIHDFLRLLYARAGTAHCTGCGREVCSQSTDQIVRQTLSLGDRARLMILSPVIRNRRGSHREALEEIIRKGFVRARINGELVDIATAPTLNPTGSHTIEAVVDRIILKEGIEQRLRESVELACRESEGMCIVCQQTESGWKDTLFSTRFSCADCQLSFPNPEPRSFSFYSPSGACTDCQGIGVRGSVTQEQDMTVFRRQPCPTCHGSRLLPFPSAVTFGGLTLAGFSALSVEMALSTTRKWQRQLEEESGRSNDDNGSGADDQSSLQQLPNDARLAAIRCLPEIHQRLQCLHQTGLGYLTLDRPTRTLSGGEYQRSRLAACLGAQLHGACFVLDEPTTGLHSRNTQQLLQTIQQLRDSGTSVIVVEHDGEIMRAADWLVDLGPGAGVNGGQLLFSGPPDQAHTTNSPTGDFLSGRLKSHRDRIFRTDQRSNPSVEGNSAIVVENAKQNNLRGVTVSIPLRQLVAVTGVSGSGKSTLIMDTLLPVARAAVADAVRDEDSLRQRCADVQCDLVRGLEQSGRVVAIDHALPGRSLRSCIATTSGIWKEIRRLFAGTRESRLRGYSSQRFSFNAGAGRCQACRGTGIRSLKMGFLPDAETTCPDCHGRRFDRATLNVRFAGRNAADVLAMTVDEACEFFSEFETIRNTLTTFSRVGLGYLTLGQAASTFSGGEAQRVRLATDLATPNHQSTLYVLDEPTTGLHPADVLRLEQILRGLVQQGHSIILIEHNQELIQSADWIIELGPEGGPAGGEIVFQGPPPQSDASQ